MSPSSQPFISPGIFLGGTSSSPDQFCLEKPGCSFDRDGNHLRYPRPRFIQVSSVFLVVCSVFALLPTIGIILSISCFTFFGLFSSTALCFNTVDESLVFFRFSPHADMYCAEQRFPWLTEVCGFGPSGTGMCMSTQPPHLFPFPTRCPPWSPRIWFLSQWVCFCLKGAFYVY